MYVQHDCLSQDGTGDGAKAWHLLQQRYSNVEKPTVVSLVRQLSRLQLGEEEKLHEYFIWCKGGLTGYPIVHCATSQLQYTWNSKWRREK